MTPLEVHRTTRADWLIAVGVFLVAMTVRMTFLLSSADRTWPHSIWYEGDAPDWVMWAADLDRGQIYHYALPMRSPAVAYLLHWIAPGMSSRAIESSTPQSFLVFKILWCGLSSLTCSFSYVAFVVCAGRRAALIGAVLCTFSFASYVIATSLNNEALYSFVLFAILVGWPRLLTAPSWWLAIVLGLLNGLANLVRQEHTLLLLMLLAWGAWRSLVMQPAGSNGLETRLRMIGRRPLIHRLSLLALVLVSAIVVCLPWSIKGARGIVQLNTVTSDNPDYDHAKLVWTSGARAAVDSYPAFARLVNFQFVDEMLWMQGASTVQAEDVTDQLLQAFGALPEPISPWVFVNLKGPFDFALANHPKAGGGFSKAAMQRVPDDTDPAIMFGRPDHLELVNHGYIVGWKYIKSDFRAWFSNVSAKLAHFVNGFAQGFTAYDIPVGRAGVRRPIDLFVPDSAGFGTTRMNTCWRVIIFALFGMGVIAAIRHRVGGPFGIVILYKVIITILFYGYARQAVSILPAFYFFVALGLAWCDDWLPIPDQLSRRLRAGLAVAVVMILLCLDFRAGLRAATINAIGNKTDAPWFGAGAFKSFELIQIEPVTTP